MSTAKPKTPEQVRREFDARGETISHWADRHGFRRQIVQDLLLGRTKGARGASHDAAVLLGLKIGQLTAAQRQSA